jgi:hypothetical protein
MINIKIIIVPLLCLILLIPGCGKTPAPAEPLDVSGISAETSPLIDNPISISVNERTELAVSQTSAGSTDIINVTWGFHPDIIGMDLNWSSYFSSSYNASSKNNFVTNYLNRIYNIELTGMRVPLNIYNAKILPDIFFTGYPADAYARGLTRTIPRYMIETYAPDYAKLLHSEPLGWQLNKADNGEYTGLCTYNAYYDALATFSVYRLDWMEKLGIMPKGEIRAISDRVYFTDTAFNMEEFTMIMRRFSREDTFLKDEGYNLSRDDSIIMTDKAYCATITRGMSVETVTSYYESVLSIMGMWGLNTTVADDNGTPMPFFSSASYKDFLTYLTDMTRQETLLSFSGGREYLAYARRDIVGWWNDNIYLIRRSLHEILDKLPNASILITPPEVGDKGRSGVGAAKSSHPYGAEGAWVIGAWVSDEKLARILALFNGLSCDPEIYIKSMYGEAGDGETSGSFIWMGEPYASPIVESESFIYTNDGKEYITKSPPYLEGVRVFSTNVIDGIASKLEYYLQPGPLYDYAVGTAGRGNILWPYKEDPQGVYAIEKAVLDDACGKKLDDIRKNYFRSVLSNDERAIDLMTTWDEYLLELYANGLQSYIDLYAKYPD